MTSRERILAALAHEQTDLVPIDLGGTESSGLTGIAWHKLMRHLITDKHAGDNSAFRIPHSELSAGPDILDPYQQVARVSDTLRKRFRIDTVSLFIEPARWIADTLGDGSPCRSPAGWQPRVEPNGDRVIVDGAGRTTARMPRGGFYYDPAGAALADCTSPADIARQRDVIATVDLPSFCDEPIEATAARACELHAKTDLAVVFNFCCHLLHGGTGLRGYEQFMLDLAMDRPLAEAILETLLEVYIERVDRCAPLLRGHIDVLLFNDDLGTQHGPMIPPATYRDLIQPRQRKLFSYAKKAFGSSSATATVPILFHSCGSVRAFIPGLIAAGVDALNPVQVSAEGMDSAGLKRDFGNDICFWGGGCDTQRVLAGGTEAEVRAEVRRRIADFAPASQAASGPGGFVFTQVHNVQPDVPAENVVAMLDEAGRS